MHPVVTAMGQPNGIRRAVEACSRQSPEPTCHSLSEDVRQRTSEGTITVTDWSDVRQVLILPSPCDRAAQVAREHSQDRRHRIESRSRIIHWRLLFMPRIDLPAWWPASLRDAIVHVETAGATGTARYMVTGLLEIVENHRQLAEAVAILAAQLPSDAPIWHIARAARSSDPAAALLRIRADLETAVPKPRSTV